MGLGGSIFYHFSSNELQNVFRIGSDTDIGMNWNSSDWLGMKSYPILSPGKLTVTLFSEHPTQPVVLFVKQTILYTC